MKLDKESLAILLTVIAVVEVTTNSCLHHNLISDKTVSQHHNHQKILNRLLASKYSGFGRYITNREKNSLKAIIVIGKETVLLTRQQNLVSEEFEDQFVKLVQKIISRLRIPTDFLQSYNF